MHSNSDNCYKLYVSGVVFIPVTYTSIGGNNLPIRYTPDNRKELYYMWETQIRDSIASGSTKKQIETLIHVIRQITPELDEYDRDKWLKIEPSIIEAETEYYKHVPIIVPEQKIGLFRNVMALRDEIYLRRLQKELNFCFDKLTHNVEWLFLKKARQNIIS